MNNVVSLDSHRPHVTVICKSSVRVIPIAFFEDVAEGRLKVSDLENGDEVWAVIVGEWLDELDNP